jgi:AcrR family transcriptional regulator
MPKVLPEYKDLIKSKIIDAALKVFEAKGFYASTMVDIARKIGMSKATVYFYFKSKEDLLKMIMITINQSLGEIFKNSFEGDNLATAIENLFNHITNENFSRLPVNLEIMAVASRDEIIKKIAQDDRQKGIYFIETSLQHQMEKGLIPSYDIHILSPLILGFCWDLIIQQLIGYNIGQLRENWIKAVVLLFQKV